MKRSKAAKIWIDYHKTHSRKKHGAFLPGHHRTIHPGVMVLSIIDIQQTSRLCPILECYIGSPQGGLLNELR
jgi:hypothetical protein